ncbi:hypothetical protein [Tunturiibacter gelidoferens]|uniref:Uncharacterized protein n=1 Tax=Tunturiibacter gelidiferens TaxID=3069689 RepID=A0ACC5NW59_9BACT|nr:hypothetical protein [Edaphobacter lichenicola]MBB5338802.1 hypothetical protein [Edaphobacter lichenicola]
MKNPSKLDQHSVRLISAIALSLTGHCSQQVLLDALLQWPPALEMIKKAASN